METVIDTFMYLSRFDDEVDSFVCVLSEHMFAPFWKGFDQTCKTVDPREISGKEFEVLKLFRF